MSEAISWVKLSEDDHHTTLAMSAGYGALVKNLSFEQRKMDGMNITVQVGESMSYVPNVKVVRSKSTWVLEAHYPGNQFPHKAPNL